MIQFAYRIGGVCVEIAAEANVRLRVDREIESFRVFSEPADISICVEWRDSLRVPMAKQIFNSGGLWSLFESEAGYQFSFVATNMGPNPYKIAAFDKSFSVGQIFLNSEYLNPDDAINPVEYPLDELLSIHRLARGEGVEVHAVGVVDECNRGHLFVGHSGAGKSTSARLWQKRTGVSVLSDDRIILRIENGRPHMYGTPWHGDAGIASPESADVHGIYLLQHGCANQFTRLSPGRAAAEVFARSFVPHHSATGLASILNLLERITRSVPCSIFQFVPDQTAVEAICHA